MSTNPNTDNTPAPSCDAAVTEEDYKAFDEAMASMRNAYPREDQTYRDLAVAVIANHRAAATKQAVESWSESFRETYQQKVAQLEAKNEVLVADNARLREEWQRSEELSVRATKLASEMKAALATAIKERDEARDELHWIRHNGGMQVEGLYLKIKSLEAQLATHAARAREAEELCDKMAALASEGNRLFESRQFDFSSCFREIIKEHAAARRAQGEGGK